MDGEGYGERMRELDREVGILGAKIEGTEDDVNRLGEKIRHEVEGIRADTREAMRDFRAETSAAIEAVEARGNERWNRARNWAIAGLLLVVPFMSALIGALVRGG